MALLDGRKLVALGRGGAGLEKAGGWLLVVVVIVRELRKLVALRGAGEFEKAGGAG